MSKITKLFLTFALLCIAGVANAGEQKVIKSVDYTSNPVLIDGEAFMSEGYPFYRMGDANGTASYEVQDGALVINNTSDEGNPWDLQPYIIDWFTVQEGYDYIVKVEYMSENSGKVNIGFGNWNNSMTKYDVELTASSDYQVLEMSFAKATFASEGDNHVLWQCRKVLGVTKIRKVEIIEITPDEPIKEPVWTNIILNSDLTSDDMRCFYTKEYPAKDPVLSTAADGAIVVKSAAKVAQDYDTQFWIRMPQVVPAGTKFKISFDYKASAAASVGTQCHNEPGDYIHWACIPGVNFTADWQTYNETVTVPSQCDGNDHDGGAYKNDFHSIAFNLSKDEPIDYYFKNIKFEIDQDAITEFDFPKPKPLFADGAYYFYNVGTKKYLGAGSSWGTHAVVNADGLDYTSTFTEDGKYTLDSQVSNGGDSHYLSKLADGGIWNDQGIFGWTFTKVDEGVYTIGDGTLFLTVGENNEVVLGDDSDNPAAKWKVKTLEDRLEEIAEATPNAPVDATFLITDANFNRNDLRKSAWTMAASNQNLSGGNNTNNCAESFHSTFTLSQKIANAPAGTYEMTAQGFYRQDEGEEEALPVFYANSETKEFSAKGDNDINNMSAASEAFTNGLYTIEPIKVYVFEDGQLIIGAKGTATSQWVIFDNFRLNYFGSEIPADQYLTQYEKALAAAEDAYWDEAYDAVEGVERDNLKRAMSEEVDLESAEALKAAIQALVAATNQFKEAKPAYDALAAAKEDFAELEFPYAAADKVEAAMTALDTPAASAEDAVAAVGKIYTAFRQYAESSAMLESDAEAEDMTQTIINPNAEEAIAEPWIVELGEGSGGSLGIRSDEPLTDGFGNSQYKYFDGGNWGAQAWDVSMKQKIMLPKGTYQLTVASRAAADMAAFSLTVDDGTYLNMVDMPHIGASNGLFGRGWNDTSAEFTVAEDNTPVVIGVWGLAESQYQWMSFTRFRLYKFSEKFVTGIANVKTEKTNDVIYDLQGRRVVAPVKGLYIVNGKKIVK